MKKGFTLLELLIVIGILAILAATTVVVLNPAQLLAQARDSQRVSDMRTFVSAINIYLADKGGSADLNGSYNNSPGCDSGATGQIYVYAAPTDNSFGRTGGNVIVALRGVSGGTNGWLPIDFSSVSGGSNFSSEPIDPTNSGNFIYRYTCDQTGLRYELNACLESEKYMPMMDGDGGNKNGSGTTPCGSTRYYEIGNDPGLDL